MKRLIAVVALLGSLMLAAKASAGPAQSGQAIAFATVSQGTLINFGGNGTKSAQALKSDIGIYQVSFQGKYPKNLGQCVIPTVSAWNNGHGEVADVGLVAALANKELIVKVVLYQSGSEAQIDGTVSLAVFCGNTAN